MKREFTDKGVILITRIKNMKPKTMKLSNRLILRKRFIIETVFDQLKNISQIKHFLHLSCISFMVNLLVGLSHIDFNQRSRVSK
uniref:transposase n=1 Tax=Candidatus Enterovibrio escicola TaxID=1927127 RepID=UPI0021E0911B|nr:transposase [Candidatus Enterovibrio escacola]